MQIKEVGKLISACEVDFEELKENIFRNDCNAKQDDNESYLSYKLHELNGK